MAITDLQLPIPVDELQQTLKKHSVIKASVFGSYARGEQTSQSDLDLLIKCSPGTSLFDIFDLQAELENQTGVKVDLVTKLKSSFTEYVEPDLVDLSL